MEVTQDDVNREFYQVGFDRILVIIEVMTPTHIVE
tara:strand:+ start:14 stop:118 length:105 start_codon:yes stop_codon:yes gene_type:complete